MEEVVVGIRRWGGRLETDGIVVPQPTSIAEYVET
jgi:hypothetical protein